MALPKVDASVGSEKQELPGLKSVQLPPPRPRKPSARPRRRGRRRRAQKRPRGLGFSLGLHPWRLLALVLALASWSALAALWWHPAFRVQRVRLYGLVLADPDQIREWPTLAALVGKPIIAVQPWELARLIQEAFPGFRQVQVEVDFPNRVEIRVQEREPVLVWQEGEEVFWVDREGVKFYAWGKVNPAWPRVRAQGTWENVSLSPQEVAFVLHLSRRLALTELVYHPEYGFGWQAPQGWQVYIGTSMHDWDARLALYEQVVQQLEAQGIRPRAIRLLSPYAVVVLPPIVEEGRGEP